MNVRRRTVLAALGAALATAGCTGPTTDENPGGTDTNPPSGTETPDPTASPPGTPSRFEGDSCPSFIETDRTVCWHARPADPPVVLEPASETFQPVEGTNTVETLQFTLRNHSERGFGLNPYAWQLHRRDGDEWQTVAPDEWIEPWDTVSPGGTYEWILATETHPTPGGDPPIHVMEPLESGTHAFSVHGTLGGESTRSETGEDAAVSIECVALFDVAVAVEDSWPENATEA